MIASTFRFRTTSWNRCLLPSGCGLTRDQVSRCRAGRAVICRSAGTRPMNRCRRRCCVFERLLKASGGARDPAPRWPFVQALNVILRDKAIPAARGAHRRRRGPHLRHGRPVPADRHLCALRPEVQADGCRSADILPRGSGRSGAAGRHHRGRFSALAGGGGDQLQRTNNLQMLPFFIFYRCSACSASAIWPGWPATYAPRLPARCHCRSHHVNGEGLQHEDGHCISGSAIPQLQGATIRPSPSKWR